MVSLPRISGLQSIGLNIAVVMFFSVSHLHVKHRCLAEKNVNMAIFCPIDGGTYLGIWVKRAQAVHAKSFSRYQLMLQMFKDEFRFKISSTISTCLPIFGDGFSHGRLLLGKLTN